MKRRKPRKGMVSLSPPQLVDNPFVSEVQRRACYAKQSSGETGWDCHEWSHATKGKLPERKATANLRNAKRRLSNNRKHITFNAVNPAKLDPTRTLTLRRFFFQELRKRFARLKGKIVALVMVEDAFGIAPKGDTLSHFSNTFTPVANCQPGQIRGSDGRCGPGIGISIPRDEMPQIKSDDLHSFITYAQVKGTNVHKETIAVQALSPTQAEFRQERVDSLPDESLTQPILVSQDQYILDGTHRWIKAWQKDQNSSVPILMIDLPLQEALDLMRSFPKVVYVDNTNPNHDEHGRFASSSQLHDLASSSIKEITKKWGEDEGLEKGLSPKNICEGFCSLFAHSVVRDIQEKRGRKVTIAGKANETEDVHTSRTNMDEDGEGHMWVTVKGRHYDPEAPDGVDDPHDLPWFSRHKGFHVLTENTRWAFQSNPQQLRAFQSWLDSQIKTELTDDTGKAAWDAYIQTGYRKGAGRAFDDTNKRNQGLAASDQRKLDFYSGTRDQFLRDSFAQPVARERVELIAQRAFDEMTNVTEDMSNKISRTLTDGLIEGKSPHDVADDLTEQVDISATKAKRIANTEIIRAHAEGQLTALETLGVEEVGVAVEWSVSGLNTFDKRGNPISPCARCKAMEGVILKIAEARGMIPLHPECKCAWLPANVGEDDEDQKSSKEDIEAAAQDADIELEVDGDRPESIIGNLFNANPHHDEKGRFTTSDVSTHFEDIATPHMDEDAAKKSIDNIKEGVNRALSDPTTKKFLEDAGIIKDGNIHVRIASPLDPSLQSRGIIGTEAGFADDEKVTLLTNPKHTPDDIAHTLIHEAAHKWADKHKISSEDEEVYFAGIHDVTKLKDKEQPASGWGYVKESGSIEPFVEAVTQHLHPHERAFGKKVEIFKDNFPKSIEIAKKKLQERGIVSNTFCPTGAGGGVDPSCSPSHLDVPNSAIHTTPRELISNLVKSISEERGLTASQKESYSKNITEVITEMTKNPGMSHSLLIGLDSIKFYHSPEEIDEEIHRREPNSSLNRGKTLAFMDVLNRVAHLTGSNNDEKTRGVWTHELMHAVDGLGNRFSRGKAWEKAYNEEIKIPSKPLSNYATTHPREGFAELGRLLLSTNVKREEVEKRFPKCIAFFRKKKLWS